jgi:hypothetical protein
MEDKLVFMGTKSQKLISDEEYFFTKHFDWVFMRNKIVKRKLIPQTCYIKTDYLNKYLNDILNINTNFILVSGCSDYSPIIKFKSSYEKIIKHPCLIKWYAQNNLSTHPKMCSLSVGLYNSDLNYENNILTLRSQSIKKIDKIFVCYRGRGGNVCGKKYVERPICGPFLNNHKNIIARHGNISNKNEFIKHLYNYKWCFCPLGNGVDHGPKIVECFLLKTIPICKKNHNAYSLYGKYPVIWINDFNEILTDKQLIYPDNIDWDNILEDFKHKNIFNKIFNKINDTPCYIADPKYNEGHDVTNIVKKYIINNKLHIINKRYNAIFSDIAKYKLKELIIIYLNTDNKLITNSFNENVTIIINDLLKLESCTYKSK